MSGAPLTVVGIGADGFAGLGEPARAAILSARLLIGSERQLALLPETEAERRPWPSPLDPLLDELVAGTAGPACVLASGDPMLHGIGATLARRVAAERLTIYPAPSAFALACARLGWPAHETHLVSLTTQPAEAVARLTQPGRRLIVYAHGEDGVERIAHLLVDRGLGPSRLTVLSALGSTDETRIDGHAERWEPQSLAAPYLVAVECELDGGATVLPLVPGLPDDAYAHDGQLTKREVRAVTLAALVPLPDQLLWDIGAGSGSIAIEWLRAEPSARAIAVEVRANRAERIAENARILGVPQLEVRCADAAEILDQLDPPDAVFVGGGLTAPDMLDRCWQRLLPGGRLVANAVTLEGEQRLVAARDALGGDLVRIAIERAEPIGRFSGWQPQRPIVQWSARKEPA